MPYTSGVLCPGVGNECYLLPVEERKVEGGVNSPGLQAGSLALKLSNFYLGRTLKILILNIEKDFSKNNIFPLALLLCTQ